MPPGERAYTSESSFLTLDNTPAGLVRSVAGGNATADVVTEKIGPDHIAKKHIAGVRYEPVEMQVAMNPKVSKEARERLEAMLRRALTGEALDFPALIARQRPARPLYQSNSGERIPTRIFFDNDSSENRTIIDLETEDHLGLLYAISKVLTDAGLDISLAKISTEKGAAIDSFYVAELDGQKLLQPERQRYIAERMLAALRALS
jgi:UTP:GlnB (protein PII) uridylyltransferase